MPAAKRQRSLSTAGARGQRDHERDAQQSTVSVVVISAVVISSTVVVSTVVISTGSTSTVNTAAGNRGMVGPSKVAKAIAATRTMRGTRTIATPGRSDRRTAIALRQSPYGNRHAGIAWRRHRGRGLAV